MDFDDIVRRSKQQQEEKTKPVTAEQFIEYAKSSRIGKLKKTENKRTQVSIKRDVYNSIVEVVNICKEYGVEVSMARILCEGGLDKCMQLSNTISDTPTRMKMQDAVRHGMKALRTDLRKSAQFKERTMRQLARGRENARARQLVAEIERRGIDAKELLEAIDKNTYKL